MRKVLDNFKNKKKRGFTLIEVLVVILIIGVLFIALVPKIGSSTLKAQETGVQARFNEFRTASTMLLKEHAGFGKIMNADNDLETIVIYLNDYLDPAVQFDNTTIQGQYCNSYAKDPWNNAYRLHVSADHDTGEGTITFMSYGPDGRVVNAESFDKEAVGADYVLSVAYDDGLVIVNGDGIEVDDSNSGDSGETGNENEGVPGGNENTGSGNEGSGTEDDGNQEEIQDEIVSGTGTIVTLTSRKVTIQDNDTGNTYKVAYLDNCPNLSDYADGTVGTYSLNATTEELLSFVAKQTGVTASGIGQLVACNGTSGKITIADEISGQMLTASANISSLGSSIGEWGSYSITNGTLDHFNIIDHYGWETGTITDKALANQLEHTIQVRLDGTIYNLSRNKVTINKTRYNLSQNCENCDVQYCDYCNTALASVPTGEVWYKISGGAITDIDTK